jgi:tRNA dimethylallyltransferase
MQKDLICLTGVTGSGKSQVAIELSKLFPIEVVSMDSAMVYRGLDIGTAKPTKLELKAVPHHLVDIIEPTDSYSVGQFLQGLTRSVELITHKKKIPLIVGGTLMYLHAIYRGLASLPKGTAEVRKVIEQIAIDCGWDTLYDFLYFIDADIAQKIKPSDHQRIERMLEIFLIQKEKPSLLLGENINYFKDFNIKTVALVREDKEVHYHLIKNRIGSMIEQGLIDEVVKLKETYSLNSDHLAMKLIGYKQVNEYLEGKYSLDDTKKLILNATNQFTKRQMTWIRKFSFIDFETSSKALAKSKLINFLSNAQTNNSYDRI